MEALFTKRFAVGALFFVLLLLSGAAAFYAQASALNYPDLLKLVLLCGVIPQAVILGVLSRIGRGKVLVVALLVVAASWLSVGELVYRVYAT